MRCSRWSVGVVCIVLVAFIWNASSVLVQAIFTDAGFVRPFFLTWVANSLFMTVMPIRWLSRRCRRSWNPTGTARRARAADEADSDAASDAADVTLVETRGGQRGLSRTARAALFVCPLWFGANFTYNVSMSMTSITASTVISSSSAAFTLLLSVLLLSEPLNLLKIAGVLLCWLGNALTLVSDGGSGGAPSNASAPSPPVAPPVELPLDAYDGPGHMLVGDGMCLLSAALYAAYTVAIRLAEPEMEDLALFFAYLGGFTFLLFGPLVLLLHLSAVEPLDILTWPVLDLLVCKGLFDNVLSDYLWAQAVLLTSPAVATVGMSLTVPLAILSEAVLPREWLVAPSAPSLTSAAAAVCVVAGFLTINTASGAADSRAGGGSEVCSKLHEPLLRPRAARDNLAVLPRCSPAEPEEQGGARHDIDKQRRSVPEAGDCDARA